MTTRMLFRLEGLEPDNLLALMTLLGLLRALEEARPDWFARVLWTVDEPPVRPALCLTESLTEDGVIEGAIKGMERPRQTP